MDRTTEPAPATAQLPTEVTEQQRVLLRQLHHRYTDTPVPAAAPLASSTPPGPHTAHAAAA